MKLKFCKTSILIQKYWMSLWNWGSTKLRWTTDTNRSRSLKIVRCYYLKSHLDKISCKMKKKWLNLTNMLINRIQNNSMSKNKIFKDCNCRINQSYKSCSNRYLDRSSISCSNNISNRLKRRNREFALKFFLLKQLSL